jgi:hypothetical protein
MYTKMHDTVCCPETVVLVVTYCHASRTYRVRGQANPAQIDLFSDAVGDEEVVVDDPETIPTLVRGLCYSRLRFIRNMTRGLPPVTTPPGEGPSIR